MSGDCRPADARPASGGAWRAARLSLRGRLSVETRAPPRPGRRLAAAVFVRDQDGATSADALGESVRIPFSWTVSWSGSTRRWLSLAAAALARPRARCRASGRVCVGAALTRGEARRRRRPHDGARAMARAAAVAALERWPSRAPARRRCEDDPSGIVALLVVGVAAAAAVSCGWWWGRGEVARLLARGLCGPPEGVSC